MARHSATVCFQTPFGRIEVEAASTGVTRVRFDARGRPREVGSGSALAVARRAGEEIRGYLEGRQRAFTVAVAVDGTSFQKLVWAAIARIPYGARKTYGELAAEVERPRAARAVGTACGANPVPILVPCHRVVGAAGSLGGFGGGLALKQRLLGLEEDAGPEPRLP